jgi:hypothetical protein
MGYDASNGLLYARVNTNNTQIALSPDGYNNNQAITDSIESPTIASGTYASQTNVGNQTKITGTGSPSFNTDFNIGDYVYWINSGGDFVLIGQVASFVSGFEASQMLLTGIASSTPNIPNPLLAGSNHLITASESVYIRIPTSSVSPTSMDIPNFAVWRQSNGFNVPSVSKLEQYSSIGNPLQIFTPSPVPVSFTIRVMNVFVPITSGGNTYWNSPQDFPQYIWALLTPISGSSTALNSQTMYRWSTQELLDGITITSNFPQSALTAAGYFV